MFANNRTIITLNITQTNSTHKWTQPTTNCGDSCTGVEGQEPPDSAEIPAVENTNAVVHPQKCHILLTQPLLQCTPAAKNPSATFCETRGIKVQF